MASVKKPIQFVLSILMVFSAMVGMAQEHTSEVHEESVLEEAAEVAAEEVGHATSEHAVNHEQSEKEFVESFIQHHLMDDHYYSFYADREAHRHYGFGLPVILIDNGLKFFMSTEEFVYGGEVKEVGGQYYKYDHGKIYKTNAEGFIEYDEHHHAKNEKPLDFSITKNVVGLILACLLLFLGFTALARTYVKTANSIPTGVSRVLEPLVLYVRDEMAVPNIGEKKYKKYMPFLLSVFFLIFLLNLLGLTPLGLNVTGNISVTLCLALFTFFYINFSGNKDYWKHIFWMPGVPVPMKIILMPIEIIGMITKPFSLMIRLFANITAGHSIVMGIIAVIYLMKESLGLAGATGISLFLAVFITFLELLVAFLQAFIFTMLSALFIGMAVQEHEHH